MVDLLSPFYLYQKSPLMTVKNALFKGELVTPLPQATILLFIYLGDIYNIKL